MNFELETNQINTTHNSTLITPELEQIFNEWESVIISQEEQQKKTLGEVRNFDEQLIIQKINQQKNKIQQLQMYEQMNENNNNALKQLIQDKQSTQEQQLKFIKEQHAQEITMHQRNLEETLQKNLKTINSLVLEKKELSDQLEQIFNKMEEEKEQNQQKVKKMKQFYEQELKNQKDNILQKEKKDREKWQKEKQEKIRELTIKGLEPELQNLIEKHNLEIKQLKLEYQQKLVKMRQELSAEQQLQLQQIKNSQLFFTSNIDFNQLTINNHLNTAIKQDSNNIKEITSNNDNLEEIQFEKSPVINQNPAILEEITSGIAQQNQQKNGIFSSFYQNPQLVIQNQDIKQAQLKYSAIKGPDKQDIQNSNVYSNQSNFLFQQQSINNNPQQPSSQLPQLIINNRVQNNFLTPHIKKKTLKQNVYNNS